MSDVFFCPCAYLSLLSFSFSTLQLMLRTTRRQQNSQHCKNKSRKQVKFKQPAMKGGGGVFFSLPQSYFFLYSYPFGSSQALGWFSFSFSFCSACWLVCLFVCLLACVLSSSCLPFDFGIAL